MTGDAVVATPQGRRARGIALALFVASALPLAWINRPDGPLRRDPLAPSRHVPVVDAQLELARRYAPWILHEFDPRGGRQDVPCPVDFDGNLRGDDDWEDLPDFELLPTLYYACLETETHWFLAYHLFHPRDWTTFDLGLHMTHENDGENLQIVVERASGRVVLLFTQAHYRGGVYANPGSGVADGRERVRGPLVLVDDAGRPAVDGAHAVVFVERCGHGIWGIADHHASAALEADGTARFAGAGWVLRPAAQGEPVREPLLQSGLVVPYALESTTAKLWPGLADGTLVGEGGLVDGVLPLVCAQGSFEVPRYYEGDRFSGPFGPDRGISPFAVDFRFGAGEVGALFFDPARRYAECLIVPEVWSTTYRDYPFASSDPH